MLLPRVVRRVLVPQSFEGAPRAAHDAWVKGALAATLGACAVMFGCGGDIGTHSGDTQLEKTCALVCARSKAAHCSADDASSCAESCVDQADAVASACTAQRDAWLACEATATFACDASGRAQASSCDALRATLTSCESINPLLDAGGFKMDSTVDQQPDSTGLLPDGALDPNTFCAPSLDDNLCTVCGKDNCCDKVTACNENADCTELATCIANCGNDDSECLDACAELVSSAVNAMFDAVSNCFEQSCAAECGACVSGDVPDTTCSDATHPAAYSCPGEAPSSDCIAVKGMTDIYCCTQ